MKKVRKWIDEAGNEIPAKRVSAAEKYAESAANKIVKEACATSKNLKALKAFIEHASEEVLEAVRQENDVLTDNRKGNYTWYNFDRSIKIEISINEPATFDDITISMCKEKLNEFLNKTVEGKEDYVKNLILDAFETRTGKLDTKRVMYLLKYKSKIHNKLYQEAMALLEKSIRRNTTKKYSRVWVKDDSGEYQAVELNYSAV